MQKKYTKTKYAIVVSILFLLGISWQVNNFAKAHAAAQNLSQGASSVSGSTNKAATVPLPTSINDFAQYIEKTRQQWQIPGTAIAIVQNGKVVFAKGFGVKKLGSQDPVDSHTVFQIGSMTKAFTSALVASMIDEKKFTWQDRVIDLYPDFQMYDPWVTREFLVKDIMAQHSGLASHAEDKQVTLGFGRDHILHSLRYIKPVSSFRSEYAYQNSLFLVAAALVEKYSGKSWEDNIKQRIFVPLQMTDSSCASKDFKISKNIAYLHTEYNGKIIPIPMSWNSYFDWIDVYAPAGAINSNVIDLSNWLMFQANSGKFADKQIMSAKNIDFTHEPQTILDDSSILGSDRAFYALGWFYDAYPASPIILHPGETSGASSIMAFAPKDKVGIIVLTNLSDTNYPLMIVRTFFDMYFHRQSKDWNEVFFAQKKAQDREDALEKTQQPPVEASAASLPLAKYVGTYQNDIYGKMVIRLDNGKLIGTIGPQGMKMQLTPWNKNVFASHIISSNGEIPPQELKPYHTVIFNFDEDNNVYEIVISTSNLDSNAGKLKKIN